MNKLDGGHGFGLFCKDLARILRQLHSADGAWILHVIRFSSCRLWIYGQFIHDSCSASCNWQTFNSNSRSAAWKDSLKRLKVRAHHPPFKAWLTDIIRIRSSIRLLTLHFPLLAIFSVFCAKKKTNRINCKTFWVTTRRLKLEVCRIRN